MKPYFDTHPAGVLLPAVLLAGYFTAVIKVSPNQPRP